MNNFNWQFLLVLICIAWAVLFLARSAIRMWKRQSGHGEQCGGCASNCETDSSQRTGDFVTLGTLKTTTPPTSGKHSHRTAKP